jgi:hypothetical protein
VLGFFTQRRSIIALIIALIIYSLDIVLVLFSDLITALARFSVSNTVILGLIGDILKFMAIPIGFTVMRIGFLMGMGQGVGAINELKKETPPTVS